MSGLPSTKPVQSLDWIITNFQRTNAKWQPGATITYSFRESLPPTNDTDITFHAYSPVERMFARMAFDLISDVCNLTFVEAPDDGVAVPLSNRIYLGKDTTREQPGVWGYAFRYGGSTIKSAEIWSYTETVDVRPWIVGGLNFNLQIHETLHTLGIPHPGTYDVLSGQPISYANDAKYAQDTLQFTVMSYFGAANSGSDHTADSLGGTYSGATPMLHDVAILQALYGANMNTRAGDTVYGYNSNTGRPSYTLAPGSTTADTTVNSAPIFCIWDGGGIDLVDLSLTVFAVNLDLRPGHFSDAFEMTNNISIAFGVTVENATTGSANDRIVGNDASNILRSGAGDDQMYGGAGADLMSGGSGDDLLIGGAALDGTDSVGDLDVAAYGDAHAGHLMRTVYVEARGGLQGHYRTYVTDLSDGSTDTLVGVERLSFSDGEADALRAVVAGGRSLGGGVFDDVVFLNRETGQVLFQQMEGGQAAGWSEAAAAAGVRWTDMAVGDANADGWADVFLQGPDDGSIYLARQGGSGFAGWTAITTNINGDWVLKGSGDMDGDGDADVVLQHTGGYAIYGRMTGGQFDGWVGAVNVPGWKVMGVGDLNGDGTDDLVIQNPVDGTIYYAKMQGGAFAGWGVVSASITADWQVRAVGDVTGDGFADVVIQNRTDGTAYYADMQGGTFHGWGVVATAGQVGTDWIVKATADVDNDGFKDVLFQNPNSGATIYANMNDGEYDGWGIVAGNPGGEWILG